MAEREGFYFAIPAILMTPKTQMHSSLCLCGLQAFSFRYSRKLLYLPLTLQPPKRVSLGITAKLGIPDVLITEPALPRTLGLPLLRTRPQASRTRPPLRARMWLRWR